MRPAGTRPRILQWKNEADEARETVAEIRRLMERKTYQPRDIAILFRTNEQPRLFETELRKARVPYVMLGSQSFFDRKEVRDLVAFLRWIDQPDDEVSLLRIINTPPRGLGGKTVAGAVATAVQRGLSLWRVLQDHDYLASLPEPARRGVEGLDRLRCEVLAAAQQQGLAEAGQTLIRVSRYLDELTRLYDDPQERDARASSVQELVNAMAAHRDREEQPSLTGFLSEIALAGRELGSEEDRLRAKNAVWLLTLHAAKGLEFPIVYMVGMEDGILPHQRSAGEDDAGIDEERRLCYVGVTRAQESLTLSLALERMRWGKPRPTMPSRFLYELTGQAERASGGPAKPRSRGSAPTARGRTPRDARPSA
jgi:DNA helicase-2/ATP-dependent DNA helicase PcrA